LVVFAIWVGELSYSKIHFGKDAFNYYIYQHIFEDIALELHHATRILL